MSNLVSGSISFINRTVSSIRLRVLYEESMSLVEEASSYFDEEGLSLSKLLPRVSSSLYISESVLLTTRLMQMISWLLLQRAFEDKEMSLEQVITEKKKIQFNVDEIDYDSPEWNDMPCFFKNLVERSLHLQNRIISLDKEIYGNNFDSFPDNINHVQTQIKLLEACFGNF
ncbi:DUF1465 family protein [Candidatus Liberibacter americanus]|uniref:Regulator of CtrA degradation n=1 Tax=Candidatus Liberibacter americanus str. Sao Paulo TaxID=1261131 RepID=U6B2W6_9HYPH|nr:DUF1465 family protein [Candidatus Liberibacter americanus]AHA27404.1 hypothetical protein lam_019 [Candidatus Liberibacter americanus str. Sao Paulo]EMS36677.1 hypothetical protein G653_00480 [Candidatus Liberibacter americanus PW_SP]